MFACCLGASTVGSAVAFFATCDEQVGLEQGFSHPQRSWPRPNFHRQQPDFHFDLFHVDGGHQPRPHRRVPDLGSVSVPECQSASAVLRYQQALADLKNCS